MHFHKILAAISFGLALHYSEIQKAWEVCDSDILCKAEKLILYITGILGIASPAVILSHVTKDLINKVWMSANGQPLLSGKGSYWGMILISLGIYSAMERYSSLGVDFIQYATDCLKLGTCEGYDALVWVHNMKMQYCNNTDFFPSDSTQLECVEGDQDCKQIDDEELFGRIQNQSEWCTLFFNKMPLMGSASLVWVSYFLSFGWQPAEDDDEDENKGDENGEDENGGDGKETDKEDDGDDGDANDVTKMDGVDKDNDGERKKIYDKKKEQSKSQERTNSQGKTNGQDKPIATQTVYVTCPFCKLSKRACIPKPLSIFCPDCGKDIKSAPKNDPPTPKTTVQALNPKTGYDNSTPRNLFPSNNVSNCDTLTTIPIIPNHPYYNVDTPSRKGICHLEGDNSKARSLALNPQNGKSDNESDISDDEELFNTYMRLAIDHKDELKSSLCIWCEICGYFHADHVHEKTQIKESTECNSSHLSDRDVLCKVCGYFHADDVHKNGQSNKATEDNDCLDSDDSYIYDEEEEDFN